MLKGNKGEWSEVYALLKLLGDKKLFVGDANLNRLADIFYPIIKIIRNESVGEFGYKIMERDLIIFAGKKEIGTAKIKELDKHAKMLFAEIKNGQGAFEIPTLEKFLAFINCHSLRASSSAKSDIRIIIHDAEINQNPELGFSIKSQLGGDSTLLNAGKTTNIIYKIINLDLSQKEIGEINNINSRSKIRDRLKKIIKSGGQLKFYGMENEIFLNNLILIDSLMPEIISELIKLFYTSSKRTIVEISQELNKTNPLKFDFKHKHAFYEYKLKRFLTDAALGMMPSKVWHGNYDATGGYLVIKEDGDIVCYHIYKKKNFEDYLFNNTRLETASTTKFEFGYIYKEGESFFIKLNLQIRFL